VATLVHDIEGACLSRGGFREEILTRAAGGAQVLTATRRLARQLLEIDRQTRTAAGCSAWVKPAILSGQDWLQEQLARLGEDWRTLSPAAARRVWEEVIEENLAAAGIGLLQVAATAARAQEAHQLLLDYDTECSGYPLSEDHQAFLRWRRAYLARLAAGGWKDPAASPARVAAALQSGRLPLAPEWLLVGYDEVPPPLQRLAELAGASCRVRILPPPLAPVGRLLRTAYGDARDEVRAAARWARGLLERGEGRIGIIVPELAAYRELIEQIFLEELDPRTLLALSDEERRFGLSLGTPLAAEGPVAAALRVLSCGRELESEQLGLLLRSPYLAGGGAEEGARARYDVQLRRLRRTSFSLDLLLRAAHDGGRLAPPRGFAAILAALQQSRAPRQATPAHWVKQFRALLAAVGWPGDRTLDSREFQTIQAWEEKLLPGFAALDCVCRPLGRQEAVGLLRRQALEEEFQVEMPDPGIQVCGVLEAGGLQFEHLWVLGLHENAWPPPSRPNPFLPRRLQVELGMPHADAAREADYARQVLTRLQAAAPEVICSYPRQDASCALRPSPLLAELAETSLDLPRSWMPQVSILASGGALERLRDDSGPALAPGTELAGGTAVLRDQALCPFRGFARHRLAARALETPGPGLDPATRGTLVHKCLELFWARIGSHAALRNLTDAQRNAALAASVAAALDLVLGSSPLAPAPALLAIEQERLCRLLDEWLVAVELERPAEAATVVTEELRRAECGGLQLATKIDRRDHLADGRSVILDYKTGQTDLGELLGERLLAPQLPLYAVTAAADGLAGVAIGQLRPGDCSLKGVARDEDLFAGVGAFAGSRAALRSGLEDWSALLERWRAALDDLGRQTLAGHAAVDPVSRQQACRSCDLAALCRIGDSDHAGAGGQEE
jgi:ATP-dependent helicase/nuclease subunit B